MLLEKVKFSWKNSGAKMPRPKKTAEEHIDELGDSVMSYLELRKREMKEMFVPTLVSEVRSYMGRLAGRPTAMTELVIRRLEGQGKVTVDWFSGDGIVEMKDD